MPITSETITAPPQLSRLVSIAGLKSTLVSSVPRWLTARWRSSSSVGVNAK